MSTKSTGAVGRGIGALVMSGLTALLVVGPLALSADASPAPAASTVAGAPAAVTSAATRQPGPHLMPKVAPGPRRYAPTGAHLTYYGGPVMSNVQVVEALYGSGTYESEVQAPSGQASIAGFFSAVTNSSFFDWLAEYNTVGLSGGNQLIGRGAFAGQTTITPAAGHNGVACSFGPSCIDDAVIQTELAAQLNAAKLPAPVLDGSGAVNSLYAFYFPAGKVITQGGTASGVAGGFCAYHGTINYSGLMVPYMVMPDFGPGSGNDVGCGTGTEFQNVTSVSSHELVESVSDAAVGLATINGPPLAWYDPANGEIGDICNAQHGVVVGYTVQTEFSNRQNNCVVSGYNANDFSISVTPAVQTVTQGQQITYNVTTASTAGQAQSIALSVAGLPAGVTGSFNPSSVIAGASSTLTLSAGYSALPATRTFTIQGSAASGPHTTIGSVTVGASTVDHIVLSPSSSSILAGQSQAYTATGYDAGNNSLGDLTAATAFTIAPNGSGTGASCSASTCTASLAGAYTVTGSTLGKTASATLNVTPAGLDHLVLSPPSSSVAAGASQAYTAAGFDAYNNSVGDVTAATVFGIAPNGPGTGAACAGTSCSATVAGAYTVTGSDSGKSASAGLTVTPGPLHHLTISPSSATIKAHSSQVYTTTGFDAYNNTLGDVTAVTTFSIAPIGIGGGASCVGSTCTVNRAGTYTVTATDGGKAATASLVVTAINGKIVFARTGLGHTHIYSADPDGSHLTALTAGPFEDLSPAWSPDGTRIAFVSSRAGAPGIYVMNADGSGVTALTSGWSFDATPAWSPDGTQIVFSSGRSGFAHIYLMNADGSGIKALTSGYSFDTNPAWSPDGTRIAFVSTRAGSPGIYVMKADGSGVMALTGNGSFDASPAWSPDGTHILFTSRRSGIPHIYVMNADGTNVTALTTSWFSDSSPTWSPDGARLAFVSTRAGFPHVYTMSSNGSGVAALTSGPTLDSSPSWQAG